MFTWGFNEYAQLGDDTKNNKSIPTLLPFYTPELANTINYFFNATVIEPTEPTREGYTFSGWYYDEQLTVPYVFSTMPAENLTLYGYWTKN